jgi:hypothetical protein
MDYYGSGPDWCIPYFWPLKTAVLCNRHAWEFYSWQNISVFVVLFLWTVLIGMKYRRTPLELIMPKLDRQLVGIKQRRISLVV